MTEKQIKKIESVTGINFKSVNDLKFTFEKQIDKDTETLKIDCTPNKQTIYYAYRSCWGSGSFTDTNIPFKLIGQITKILEVKNG